MPNKNLTMKERIAGCMYGLAIGDAFGYEVKSLDFEQIKKTYGKKGLVAFKPDRRTKNVRISDETQLALFTAHGILWADSLGAKTENASYATYVFYAYQQWLYTQEGGTASIDYQWILDDNQNSFPCEMLDDPELAKKRGPTRLLVQTLAQTKDLNYGKIIRPINNNRLFDCVPRIAPAGLYFYCEPERAFRMGCEFAAITHTHPTAFLAAGCFAAIISYILAGETIERSVLNTLKILKEYDDFEDCFTILDRVLTLLDEDTAPMEAVAQLGSGRNAESALAIGVYCACVHYEFEYAIQLAANQDGNSDACAAIAGALKGAYSGYPNLPSKWVKSVQFSNLIKSYSIKLCKSAPKRFL